MSVKSLSRLAGSISAWFSKMSGRERLLANAAIVLVVGGIALQAYDLMEAVEADNLQAHINFAAAKDASRPADPGVVRGVRQAEKEVVAWSWTAPSIASGRVSVENNIEEMARSADLKDPVVEDTGLTEKSGDVYFVRLHVSSRDNISGFERFGHALVASTKGFLFEKLSISAAPPEDRLDFDLSLPLVVPQDTVR
jgi:hypothetical protein